MFGRERCTINTTLAVGINANITNRLDVNGNLENVTVGGIDQQHYPAPPTLNSPTSASSLFQAQLNGSRGGVSITDKRPRVAAIPTISTTGPSPLVTGTIEATNLNLPSQPLLLAAANPTLLSSLLNYGVPCTGIDAAVRRLSFQKPDRGGGQCFDDSHYRSIAPMPSRQKSPVPISASDSW